MDMEKPPIKVLVPGRVFRSDPDATHSPMFHQMEGLVVDKGITLCDLQGMLDKFVQALFGPEVKTRLRPSYFRSPSPASRSTSPALSAAAARAARSASTPAGSRSWVRALSITAFWKTVALTPTSIPASPSASALSVSPC